MKEVDIVSKIVNREGGTFVPSSKGTQPIDLSDYLLKSIWDKVWEIRTDSQGTEYVFGKLPVVTQSGITMYSGDGVNVPSLASGLPFDGRTIWYNPDTKQIEVIGGTGGGSGEGVSNFWDLRGIPSWITISKPKYTYSEIEGTPDLSGFATQNWIISQGYASAEELKKYIPISGYTEVSGEKNFTGGLKVNGSPIYYDTEKKYWKLEGDLLVTGGVTMYGVDSTDIPSLINSLPVATTKEKGVAYFDPDFFSVSSDGKVSFIGETGSGLDITALQNYLTQNSYLNVTEGDSRYLKLSGGSMGGDITLPKNSAKATTYSIDFYDGTHKYLFAEGGVLKYGASTNINTIIHSGNYSSYALPLSGGTLTNTLRIDKSTYPHLVLNATDVTNGQPAIALAIGNEVKGFIGYSLNIGTYLYTTYKKYYLGIKDDGNIHYTKGTIWHSGNDGADSGLDADLLDGEQESTFAKWNSDIANSGDYRHIGYAYKSRGWVESGAAMSFGANGKYFMQIQGVGNESKECRVYARYIFNEVYSDWKQFAFTDSNVASATKLQTERTIWGKSFDGSSDVYGTISDTYGILPSKDTTYDIGSSSNQYRYVYASWFGAKTSGGLYLGANNGNHLYINTNGNVTIGSSNLAGTSYKLYVSGNLLATGGITTNDSVTINGIKLSKSKDGVLFLDGNLVVKGGVTMYGTDATSSPSIFDSLPVASTTKKGIAYFDSEFFSVASDGKVSFIGKTDGFNATELQNYLTQNSYLNTTLGDNRYLKLSGGTLTNTLRIDKSTYPHLVLNATDVTNGQSAITLAIGDAIKGYVGYSPNIGTYLYTTAKQYYLGIKDDGNIHYTKGTIWHSGNDGADSGLNADLLDGLNSVDFSRSFVDIGANNYKGNGLGYTYSTAAHGGACPGGFISFGDTAMYGCQINGDFGGRSLYFRGINEGSFTSWKQIAFTDSNVASATKLQNARTIWGQSFDGTGNVDGLFRSLSSDITSGSPFHKILAYPNSPYGLITRLYTNGEASLQAQRESDDSQAFNLILQPLGGYLGVGMQNPLYKVHVNGDIATNNYLRVLAWSGYGSGSCNMWYDGNKKQLFVNTGASFSYNCEISGTFTVNGATYLHGDVFVEELNTYDVIPRTSSTYDLGNSSYKWNNVYASSMIAGYIHGGGSALYLGNSDNSSYIYIREDMKASSESWSLTTSGTMSLSGDLTSGSYGSNCVAKFQGIGSGNGYHSVVELITNNEVSISYSNNSRYSDSRRWSVGRASSNSNYRFNFWNASYNGAVSYIDLNGNFWVAGGITMYSDRRKKTILRDVELSLKEVANAPLIEHYYNSDDKKTIHVGSIAQYWAGLNDWFCKLDNEGYYTMEVQNAALASAISVARELDRYETKTDKQIKKLKKRICELEEEVERLKSA